MKYSIAYTSGTYKEIADRFDVILKDRLDFAEIERLIQEYPAAPKFLLPYFQSLYYKTVEDFDEALPYIIEAESLLKLRSEVDSMEWDCLYKPYIKKFYGQAGEIFSNCNYAENALNAFKHYQMYISETESADVSEGLLSFRPFNEYMLQDLINGEVTTCSPAVMNDPFDTPLLHWGKHLLDRKASKKHINHFVKALDNYRIRSFSRLENKDGEMIKNIQMWSHYAQNHEGICIQYNFSRAFAKLSEDNRVIRFKEIDYDYVENEKTVDLTLDKMDTHIGLCIKQKFWEYENEVRLISYSPFYESPFIPIELDSASKISKIYFGARCSDRHIETIKSIFASKDIEFYKMEIDYSDIFSLNIVPLDN